MNQIQQAACDNFRGQISQLAEQLKEASGSLEGFIRDQSKYEAFVEAFSAARTGREQFQAEYQQKALELLSTWYPDQYDHDGFLHSVSFDSDGRVSVGDINLMESQETYFPTIIRKLREGYLTKSHIESLDYLEECGQLYLVTCVLRSVDRLKKAGFINCTGSLIESFDSLEEVDGSFTADHSRVKDLPSLRRVGGDLFVKFTPNLKSLPALRKVGEVIYLAGSGVETMDALEEVDSLDTYTLGMGDPTEGVRSSLRSVKKLKRAKGLALSNSDIENMESLEEVDQHLTLSHTKGPTFPKLRRVGTTINVHHIENLDLERMFPALEEVGLSSTPYIDDLQISRRDLEQAEAFLRKRKSNGKIYIDDISH